MKTYSPLSDSCSLHLPSFLSEFDIQAEIFSRLRRDGFQVRGSVKIFRAVFDLVVYNAKGRAIAIIETKRDDQGARTPFGETVQGLKYRHYSVPVVLFWDLSKYDELKNFLLSKNPKGEFPDETDLRVTESKKESKRRYLRNLRRRLDVAAMAAFDASSFIPENKKEFSDLETLLEMHRDKVDEKYRNA